MHSSKDTKDFKSRLYKLYENAILTEQKLSSPSSHVEQELLSHASLLRQELGDIINMQKRSNATPCDARFKNTCSPIHFDTNEDFLSRPLSKDGRIDSALAQAMNKKLVEEEDTHEDEPPVLISTAPPFIPHFFRLSFAEFTSLIRIFNSNISEEYMNLCFQYLNHLDVILLFFISVLSDWFLNVRLEWILFTLYTCQIHYKAFQESREVSLLFLFIGSCLTGICWEFQILYPWIRYLFPFLSSVLVQWACIGYFRRNDPNALAVWITFIILDLLLKRSITNLPESILAIYVTVHAFFMFFLNAYAVGLNEKHRNEAAGISGYTIQGQKMESWSLMAIKEKFYAGLDLDSFEKDKKSNADTCFYYSNHWSKKDRFELIAQHISDTSAEFSFEIPESLATSLILERKDAESDILQSGTNITHHLSNVPSHYIQSNDVAVFVNNQQWKEFELMDSYPNRIILQDLEPGKSYKMRASIQGYFSCFYRFITKSSQGNQK